MSMWIRGAMLLAVVGIGGCGGPNTAPSPTPPNLAGFWAGSVGAKSVEGRSLGVAWSATQTAQSVSGTATFSTLPPVAAQITFVGPLTGTVTGNEVALTYTATFNGNGASCTLSGTGTASVVDANMAGTFNVSFAACDALGLEPPTTMEFAMTRQ